MRSRPRLRPGVRGCASAGGVADSPRPSRMGRGERSVDPARHHRTADSRCGRAAQGLARCRRGACAGEGVRRGWCCGVSRDDGRGRARPGHRRRAGHGGRRNPCRPSARRGSGHPVPGKVPREAEEGCSYLSRERDREAGAGGADALRPRQASESERAAPREGRAGSVTRSRSRGARSSSMRRGFPRIR